MSKAKIAMIGLGGVASAHLKAYETLADVSISHVCDVNEARVREVARETGATAYTSYQDLLAEADIDLALVLTPANVHREIVEAAAEKGVHVLCEKPLAATLEDGEAMVEACRRHQVKFFYGSSYRHLPAVKTARQMIAAGEVGEVMLMTEQLIGGNGLEGYGQLGAVHYPHGGPGGAGMGLVDHGVHLIDIFPWLINSPITSIFGDGQISGEAPITEFAVMRFASGAVGHLLYNAATYASGLPNEGAFSGGQSWLVDGTITDSGRWEEEPGSISVYGTKGTLRVFHYTNKLFLRNEEGVRQIELAGRPAFGHFATQLEECIRTIREGGEPAVGGEAALTALRALFALYEKPVRGAMV